MKHDKEKMKAAELAWSLDCAFSFGEGGSV